MAEQDFKFDDALLMKTARDGKDCTERREKTENRRRNLIL